MSFTEDFTGFFNDLEFADVVHHVVLNLDFNGIFETPQEAGKVSQDGAAFSGINSYFLLPTLLMPETVVRDNNFAKGDELTVNGTTYRIASPPLFDGTGLSVLPLGDVNANDTAKSWKK